MIISIQYINSLNLSWIKKCLFLRNMEPLRFKVNMVLSQVSKTSDWQTQKKPFFVQTTLLWSV